MNVIAELTISALRQSGVEDLPRYEQALLAATDAEPPACSEAWYGEKYRELSCDPSWFSNSLIANAEKEAEGSRLLWEMGGRIGNTEIAELIRKHAIDEGRHCLYYISLVKMIFPTVPKESIQRLKTLSPGYDVNDFPPPAAKKTDDKLILDELIQINIGEIRTRIQQLLMKPVALAYAPEENRDKVTGLIDVLGTDETRHIAYTSRLIEDAAKTDPEYVLKTTVKRWGQFNQLTMTEVKNGTFESS